MGRYGTRHGGRNLTDDAALWMTPQIPTGGRSVSAETVAARGRTPEGKRTVGLESQARLWNTPRACADKAGRPREQDRDGLQEQALRWPTPRTCEGLRSSGMNRTEIMTAASLCFLRRPETETPGTPSSPEGPSSLPRSLNPSFVEWLMGWPPGWTGSGCSETEWFLWRRRMRGELSTLPCGRGG